MPINLEWKDMIQSIGKQYKGNSVKCRDLTDGTKVCVSTKAWSVFFATMRKKGWNESKPKSKSINETVINEAIDEFLESLVEWAIKPKEKS